MPVETIGSSLSVYASQNHGAGKPQRIRQGVRASLQLSLVVSTVLGVFLLLCGRQMTGLFLAEPSAEILTVVQRFLLITAVPGILAGVMQVYQQVLRGVDKANQALMGGVMQLITKLRWWLWAHGECGIWMWSGLAGPPPLWPEPRSRTSAFRRSCGKWKQNKTESAPGRQIALRGRCVLIDQLSRRLSSTALTTSSPT